MAEEFADLTNSRVNDSRYANNVVFDEAGLSELLTHIKNYPVIDIEYIDENDKDAIHTDKKVWETYTEGTPCIKITFGDEDNKSGNLSLEDIALIKGWEQDLKLYSGVQSIYNKYKSVESEYKGLIRNLKDELQQIINNVYTVYYNYIHNDFISNSLHDTNMHWEGKYYDLLLDTNHNLMGHFRQDNEYEGSNTGFIVDKFYYKITFEIADFTNEAVLDSFIKNNNSITDVSFYTTHYGLFNSLTDIVNKDCIVPFKGYVQNTNPENIDWTIEVGDKAAISNATGENFPIAEIQNQFDHYNDLLIKTIQMLSNDYTPVQTNATFDPNVTYYILDNQDIYQKVDISDFVAGTTYYYRAGNDNNHIRNLLRQYIDYIRESRVNCYEEIRKFLIANDKTETVLQTPVEEFDTNPNSAYQKLASHIDKTYRKSTKEIQDNINDRINSAYERMGENAIKGYKYVKVGSNITFDKNFDTVNEINTSAGEQKFGTYRMTINGHTYEVPVKGFGASTNSQFQSSGSIIPNLSSGNAAYDLGSVNNSWKNLYVTNITDKDGITTFGTTTTAQFIPNTTAASSIGTGNSPWTTGYFTNLVINGNTVSPTAVPTSIGNTSSFWRGGYTDTQNPSNNISPGWSNTLLTRTSIADNKPSALIFSILQTDNTTTTNSSIKVYDDHDDKNNGNNMIIQSGGNMVIGSGESPNALYNNAINGYTQNNNTGVGEHAITFNESGENMIIASDASIYFLTNCGTIDNRNTSYLNTSGYFYSTRVYNAVFNDYAEYRSTIDLTPGHVVVDNDNGSLSCATKRLQPGAQVISDTFGHSMGETDTAKTPLAVAGRVLVYTYQPRENYHAGMAVCSAPNGTVDIMTREEICKYPDCIVGVVSEIPQYEYWGTDNVKVDGRIWIKVK